MPDQSLLDRFLRGEIDNRSFSHADHVRVGFELLKAHDFATAAYRFSRGLKGIAARAGNPGAYHETITMAFMSLIAERSAVSDFDDLEQFSVANRDVMKKDVLERWYAPERLKSDLARRTFILPEAVR